MQLMKPFHKCSVSQCRKNQGGEPTSPPRVNNGQYLQYQKKIICDQMRQSATSPVLQGQFQCHKKQLARINVIDLK